MLLVKVYVLVTIVKAAPAALVVLVDAVNEVVPDVVPARLVAKV